MRSVKSRDIEIVISGGSVVKGDVIVNGGREAVVRLSDGGEVRGRVRGAEVVRDDEPGE